MEHPPFEDVFPIQDGDFPLLCLFTGGYYVIGNDVWCIIVYRGFIAIDGCCISRFVFLFEGYILYALYTLNLIYKISEFMTFMLLISSTQNEKHAASNFMRFTSTTAHSGLTHLFWIGSMYGIFTYIYPKDQPSMDRQIFHMSIWVLPCNST